MHSNAHYYPKAFIKSVSVVWMHIDEWVLKMKSIFHNISEQIDPGGYLIFGRIPMLNFNSQRPTHPGTIRSTANPPRYVLFWQTKCPCTDFYPPQPIHVPIVHQFFCAAGDFFTFLGSFCLFHMENPPMYVHFVKITPPRYVHFAKITPPRYVHFHFKTHPGTLSIGIRQFIWS